MSHDFTDPTSPRGRWARASCTPTRPVRRPENLVTPAAGARPAGVRAGAAIYDGWETRRRRTPGNDLAIVGSGCAAS